MQKKLLSILLLAFFLITVSLLAIYIVSLRSTASQKNKYLHFTEAVKTKILSYTDNKQLPQKIVLMLNQLNDPKASDEAKYKTLLTLEFYFANEYSSYHDPSIREFVKNVMGNFAKDNLSKYYKEANFNEVCADPKCGQEIDKELNKIIQLINSDNNIEKAYRDTFIDNLKTAAYLPDSDILNKQFGLGLVASGLEEIGQKSASDTANLIKIYFKNKYSKDLPINKYNI